MKTGDKVFELDSATLKDKLHHQTITAAQGEANSQNAKLAREAAEIAVKEFADGVVPQERESIQGAIELAQDELAWAGERIAEAKGDSAEKKAARRQAEIDRVRAQRMPCATPDPGSTSWRNSRSLGGPSN